MVTPDPLPMPTCGHSWTTAPRVGHIVTIHWCTSQANHHNEHGCHCGATIAQAVRTAR